MATIEEAKVFLFNLETTGLYPHNQKTKKPDICQIGVLSYPDEISFCRCVVPSIDIEPKATAVSGFSQNCQKRLLLKEQEVTNTVTNTVSKFQALTDFVAFLETNSEPGSTICLVGYYSDKHDVPFLKEAFDDCEIPMVIEVRTLTSSDAFPLLWKIAEDVHDPLGQKLAECDNKKRQTVHRNLFGITAYNDTDTHDAMRDVKQLRDIIDHPAFPINRLVSGATYLVAKTTKPILIAQELSTRLPTKPTEAKETAIQRNEVHNPSRKRRKSFLIRRWETMLLRQQRR